MRPERVVELAEKKKQRLDRAHPLVAVVLPSRLERVARVALLLALRLRVEPPERRAVAFEGHAREVSQARRGGDQRRALPLAVDDHDRADAAAFAFPSFPLVRRVAVAVAPAREPGAARRDELRDGRGILGREHQDRVSRVQRGDVARGAQRDAIGGRQRRVHARRVRRALSTVGDEVDVARQPDARERHEREEASVAEEPPRRGARGARRAPAAAAARGRVRERRVRREAQIAMQRREREVRAATRDVHLSAQHRDERVRGVVALLARRHRAATRPRAWTSASSVSSDAR